MPEVPSGIVDGSPPPTVVPSVLPPAVEGAPDAAPGVPPTVPPAATSCEPDVSDASLASDGPTVGPDDGDAGLTSVEGAVVSGPVIVTGPEAALASIVGGATVTGATICWGVDGGATLEVVTDVGSGAGPIVDGATVSDEISGGAALEIVDPSGAGLLVTGVDAFMSL